jgi:DNA-binding GntR family transcriptional regulator
MPRRSSTHHPGGKQSIRQKAYQLIQHKIAAGELAAGTIISELALSRELGCSRAPIREATGQLLAEGLLELSTGGGIIVTRLTRQSILELYELREALEVFAVGRAAANGLREADRKRLEGLIEETTTLIREMASTGEEELTREQMKRCTVSDLGFHALLMRTAANSRILKVVNDTSLMIRIFGIERTGHRQDELERIYHQHRAILQAVLDRDAECARKLLSRHIQSSSRDRLEQFDLWEREHDLANLDSSTSLNL